ncbi:MAG: glycosyl hydrolase family 18 protein [Candidatus Limnocylindria bacterium]
MSTRSRLSFVLLASAMLLGADPARAADPTPSPTPLEVAPADGPPSIHAEMLAEHELEPTGFTAGAEPMAMPDDAGRTTTGGTATDGNTAATGVAGLPNGLFREVFGYLPYWRLTTPDLANLDYSLVSTLAYFSIGAQSTGTLAKFESDGDLTTGWGGWTSAAMTGVINAAHARGVKVVPTVTMMAWNTSGTNAMTALLTSPANRTRLAGEISAAVRLRNADGVNLDFEPVASLLRSQYTAFVREVKARLVADGAGSFVTVATMAGAATWATGYDVVGLTAPGAADALMVMAYDFNWSGSSRAGGVAPIDSPHVLDVETAMADHLGLVPASKLIWGVPYYGRAWTTQTRDRYALTCKSSSICPTGIASANPFGRTWAPRYLDALDAIQTYGRRWDDVGQVPWYSYTSSTYGTSVQGYYDDAASLTAKYDRVNGGGLRGIGIWHLLMDGSRRELWNALDTNFRGAWFEDIIGSPFRADILWIAEAGITGGCGPELFCPKSVVTREQMASFLARALNLPPASRDSFTDDETSGHEADINRVAQAGITSGCGPGRFCPKSVVTREQMASFLARAMDLPAATGDFFTDDETSDHEADINRMAQAGITGGCDTTTYCPRGVVMREQMAAFLHRALGS